MTLIKPLAPLKKVRIVSLALNLPGPAALMRCRAMGATCIKIEPPVGDPMQHYAMPAFEELHSGIQRRQADLKTEKGQALLHRELAKADILLTSFRPSAMTKLGLDWKGLHRRHPQLSLVAIFGSLGAQAEAPGHDLTYLAENGLVTGNELPATLYADMAGSLMASEAILQVLMNRVRSGKGHYLEVSLASAATYLALPRTWELTTPGQAIGGGHAGYQVYSCKDGRVAVAALEPHFAQRLCEVAGMTEANMFAPATHRSIRTWFAGQTRKSVDKLVVTKDIPMHSLKR